MQEQKQSQTGEMRVCKMNTAPAADELEGRSDAAGEMNKTEAGAISKKHAAMDWIQSQTRNCSREDHNCFRRFGARMEG